MDVPAGMILGFVVWFFVRYGLGGFYTVGQNERGVKTRFGRAERIPGRSTLDDPISDSLTDEEKPRYDYPVVQVIPPGGPYFRWPWERIYKVSVATQTMNMAMDLDDPGANAAGTTLEAVTKDQLNTGLTGQIRYRVAEANLYAYLFGVKRPIVHVMGYFVSILRERIANFCAPEDKNLAPTDGPSSEQIGVSINDLRKNLRDLNDRMERECQSSVSRYGIVLEASLITGIDPPPDVESALAAINTAHNQVSSEVSLAQASADQRIVQSRRAVEIETLKAYAEAEPLKALANQLAELKRTGPEALANYLRNVRLPLYGKTQRAILEADRR